MLEQEIWKPLLPIIQMQPDHLSAVEGAIQDDALERIVLGQRVVPQGTHEYVNSRRMSFPAVSSQP